jgi:secreted trypsin-like serine protease
MTRVEIDSIEAIVNYQSRSDSSNQRYRVVSAKLSHPNYEYRSNANDIMLLRLDQPVYGIPTPSIQGSDTLAPGDAVKVLGMGKTGGAVANDLQVVTVEIIRHGDCNDANSYNGQIFKNLMICAAAPGKDSCNGDSGKSTLYVPGC